MLAACSTRVPGPDLAKVQLPALAPVPPEPVWSAMPFDRVCATPAPGAKFTVPLPCRKMPAPKAEPAVAPRRHRRAGRDGAAADVEGAGDIEGAALLHEDRAAQTGAAAAAGDTGAAAVAAAKAAGTAG